MRICFISMEYPPETGWGGIGTYLDNLTHTLAEMGHEVHVIARSANGKYREYIDNGVYVYRLKEASIKIAIWPFYFRTGIMKKLKAVMAKLGIYAAAKIITSPLSILLLMTNWMISR